MVGLAALVAVPVASAVDAGLVAHYPFDGDLTDRSGNGRDGSVQAPAQTPSYVAGVDGRAAQFDGIDDAVRFLGVPATAFNGNFTISFFVRLPQVTEPVDILGRRQGCANPPPAYLQWVTTATTPTRARFELVSGTSGGGSGRNLVAGEWRHMAVTRTTSSGTPQFRIYDAGTQSGSVSNGPVVDLSALDAPFGISVSPCIASGRRPFDGAIDELRIYNRALSDADIATLAAGEGIRRLGPVTVTPPVVTAAASVVVSVIRPSLPPGGSCEIRLGGVSGVVLGALAADGDGNLRGSAALPSSLAVGSYDLHAVCTCPVCEPYSIGRDRVQVVAPPVVSLSRSSGHVGLPVDFEVSGLLGDRIEVDFGGRRVYGPLPAQGGTHSGRFFVPRPLGALPAAATVTVRGLNGRAVVASASAAFTELVDPGYRVRVVDGDVPVLMPPETAVTVSGRLEAADGQPGRRTINVYFRSQAGRVIPLGRRDVVPDAQGNFAIQIELPSAGTQDGYIARGPGSIFYSVVEIDPLTGAVRNTQGAGGITEASGYEGLGAGGRAEVTVRDHLGNPLRGAYVLIGAGAANLRDPDGANSTMAQVGPLNQYSAEALDLSLDACPVNLAQGYTDQNGRFSFEIDPNAARNNALLRRAVCEDSGSEGCVQTLSVATTITIRASQLGYGEVRDGVAVPTVIPASFVFPDAGVIGGRFVAPDGTPYNSPTEVWRPAVSLPPITPSLTVVPYLQRGEMQPMGTGPGGPDFIDPPLSSGRYDLGSWFDVGSVGSQAGACDGGALDPRPQDPARVCVTGNPLGEQRLHYFHDANIAGTPQAGYPRLVICGDGGSTCASGTVVPMYLESGAGIGAACGQGVSRWSVRFPNAPVAATTAAVGGRIEVRSTFTPAGGGTPVTLNGSARLRKRMVPLPEWFLAPEPRPGGQLRFSGRTVRQSSNGAVFLYADESLSGGGPRSINASSSEFGAVNLPSQQRNSTTSDRRIAVTGGPGAVIIGEASAIASDNEIANNDGKPVSADAGDLQMDAAQRRTEEIIDTGKIPLFRFTYGVPPIAEATLGADFWLKAGLRYGGGVMLGADVPNIVYITEPFSEFGIDLFFDLSVIAGLVSASVEASATVYVANPVIYDSAAPSITSNQCFSFTLSATFEVCVLFCASYRENLVSVVEANPSTYRNCCIVSAAGMPGFPESRNAPFDTCPAVGAAPLLPVPGALGAPQRPRLKAAPDASIAYAPDGRGAMTYAGADGRVVVQSLPAGALEFGEQGLDIDLAVNITSTATAALTLGRGVVVWSYVPPPADAIESRTQASHIRWAELRAGQGELIERDLTPVGSGDGNVVVASCPAGVGNCPAGGEVTAVWMRRIGAQWQDHHYALMYARYRPGTGWGPVSRVDPGQGATSDLQPTVAYLTSSATAVVAWARKASAGLAAQETRRIAYRFLGGTSPVRIANDLPAGVAWPSLARRIVTSGQLAQEQLVLAYTVNVVDPALPAGQPRAFIGNANALHVARATVGANGTLSFADERLRDTYGRDLRAEKPNIVADNRGGVAVGFNGLGFGPDVAGNTQRSSDPIGMLSGQGDFVLVRPRLDGTPVSVVDLEVGSVGAFKPAFTFNPALDAYESVSQPLAVGTAVVARAAERHGIRLAGKGTGTSLGTSARRASLGAGPDFRIDEATTSVRRIQPGASVPITVTVRNIGRDYDPSAGPVELVATWNAPDGVATAAVATALPALGTESVVVRELTVPAPAAFAADELQVLMLTVRTATDVGEADATDNVAFRHFNTLARPVELVATGEPGQAMVFLRWTLDDADDDRIAGWRVFRVADDGARVPLGSTPVPGFVDLTAVFGQARRYVVVSYSDNGVESAESDQIVAMPASAGAGPDALFADGFELAK